MTARLSVAFLCEPPNKAGKELPREFNGARCTLPARGPVRRLDRRAHRQGQHKHSELQNREVDGAASRLTV